MMKECGTDVVQMAQQCEQAAALFVVPYLYVFNNYINKREIIKCVSIYIIVINITEFIDGSISSPT